MTSRKLDAISLVLIFIIGRRSFFWRRHKVFMSPPKKLLCPTMSMSHRMQRNFNSGAVHDLTRTHAECKKHACVTSRSLRYSTVTMWLTHGHSYQRQTGDTIRQS